MILWAAFAITAAVVIAALARPMLLERTDAVDPREADLAIYRDQLAEIDADLDRGLINDLEAENARVELARRLLKSEEVNSRNKDQAPDKASGEVKLNDENAAANWTSPASVAYASAVIIPLLALTVYLAVGSPTMPGMPQSARMQAAPGKSTVEQLVAKVEAQLRETPEDGRGWDAVAPVYLRLRRFDDATNAFAQAIRLQGETTKRLRGFAEATVLANNGIVGETAQRAYRRILAIEPGDTEARFWLALADEQEGKVDKAKEVYGLLLKEAAPDAPWRKVVEARLDRLGTPPSTAGQSAPATAATGEANTPSQEPPGPTPEDVAAAKQLSPKDQQAFINSMVERLAGKLEKNPADLDGWLRLVRAYAVLGRKDDANRALAAARENIEPDSQNSARLDQLANELGLGT